VRAKEIRLENLCPSDEDVPHAIGEACRCHTVSMALRVRSRKLRTAGSSASVADLLHTFRRSAEGGRPDRSGPELVIGPPGPVIGSTELVFKPTELVFERPKCLCM
jgi:hypothetical protein